MKYRTKDCECLPVIVGVGGKRPDKCPCGNRWLTEREYAKLSVGVGVEANGESRNGAPLGVDSSAPAPAFPANIGASSTPRRRSKPKRSEPRRDWTLARAKVEEENFSCRVCGAPGAEAAHILGRKFDQPISPGAKTLLVLPDRIVPLCNEEMGSGCHVAYDTHILDLLPYLTASEQAQAVLDAGSMGLALKRISPMLEMAA